MKVGQDHAKTVLSQHQTFHKAQKVALELATVASEVGNDEFEYRLTQMKLLKDKWMNGENVTLVSSNNSCKSYNVIIIYVYLFL